MIELRRDLTVEKEWTKAADMVVQIAYAPEAYTDVYSYMLLEEAYYGEDYRLAESA